MSLDRGIIGCIITHVDKIVKQLKSYKFNKKVNERLNYELKQCWYKQTEINH